MRTLNIIFGIVSVLSFAFALWQYHKNKIMVRTEREKAILSIQRLKQTYNSLHSVLYNVDQIIQAPKSDAAINISTIQQLARNVRSQVYVIMRELESEKTKMKEWRYGKMILSDQIEEENYNNVEKNS